MTIHDEYLHYQEKYEKKYGKDKTLVLLQVGSFHEAYATETRGYDLAEISRLLNITLTRKDKSVDKIDEHNPYMLGFPSVATKKYVNQLLESGYTVIVYDQVTAPPNPKRALVGVFSPGTYIDEAFSPDSNNMVSVFLDYEKQMNGQILICVGLSRIDLTTGENTVHEVYDKQDDRKYALDETVRFISSFAPKEILIYNRDENYPGAMKKDDLISYLDLDNRNFRYYEKIEKNFFKLSYQNQFLEKIWKDHGLLSVVEYIDMERTPYAMISYMALLDYAYQHDESLINNLYKPEMFHHNRHLILGNNAVYQLNILDSYVGGRVNNQRYKSLFDVVNQTSTPMGRRLLKTMLTTPIVSTTQLGDYYNWTEEALNIVDDLETNLRGILDLERIHRKISLNKVHQYEIYNLLESYQEVILLIEKIKNKIHLSKLVPDDQINKLLHSFIEMCHQSFDMDSLKKYNLNDMSTSFFKKGVYEEIDEIQRKIDDTIDLFNNICVILSGHIDDKPSRFSKKATKKVIKKSKNNVDENQTDEINQGDEDQKIYLKRNERDGYYLSLTAKRAEILKENLKKVESIPVNDHYSINPTDLEFRELKQGKKDGNTKIFFKELRTKSENLDLLKEKIAEMIKAKYEKLIDKIFREYGVMFKHIDRFVAKLDYVKSNAKVAKMFNYVRPKIITDEGKPLKNGCISCQALRHPIIERIKTDSEYVPHSVTLGQLPDKFEKANQNECTGINGMLIYGHNFCGKSSLMKAIGLSVVMAQAGMFVPATQFRFSPYDTLFARITGDDDLFKGLSSFGLEMTELKAILKRTGSKTLVIGDEVCRGTEHISGNAIVAATIISLAKTGSSFIFATHLHEIAQMERIKALNNVKSFHLSVRHDPERDVLIFDRQLRDGPGESIYGVMVARYIINDPEFNKLTQDIKHEMLGQQNKILRDKSSRYDKNLFMDSCSVCDKKLVEGDHTHHINFQKDCKDGFVINKPHLKMNAKANTAPLCHDCHDKTHEGKINIEGYEETSQGRNLKYTLVATPSEESQESPESQQDHKKHVKVRKYPPTDVEKVLLLKGSAISQKDAQRVLRREHKLRISTQTIKKIWDGNY